MRDKKTTSFSDSSHPVLIPFNFCETVPANIQVPEFKPLEPNNITVEELDIANHKIDQYSRGLDNLINKPFVTENISWFTYFTVTAIVIIATINVLNVRWKRLRRNKTINCTSESAPRFLSRIFLRPVLRTDNCGKDIELNEITK